MKKVYILIILLSVWTILLSLSSHRAAPLGELGFEIADSIEVIMNRYEYRNVKFRDRRRLSMLRVLPDDTIYGSSWFSSASQLGVPQSYVFWTNGDTISFNGIEASPQFQSMMPEEATAINYTKIAISGAEYDSEELGYFITYIIIVKDGKFTIKSRCPHKGRTMSL